MNSNSNHRKIYFRLDAGGLIGFGHLGRVEAIAEACSDLGIEPILVIRKRPSLINLNLKFKVIWLNEISDTSSSNPNDWINGTIEQETEDFFNSVLDPNLVFVDHYGLNDLFHIELQKKNVKTATVLDLTKDIHVENIVLNYNLGVESKKDQFELTSPKTTFLLGNSFSPIKKSILEIRKKKKLNKNFRKIGIYLGGVSFDLVEKLFLAITQSTFLNNKEVKWILNNNQDIQKLLKISRDNKMQFLERIEDISDFYFWSDIIIGACGISFLERSVVGLPQVLFKVADNQEEISQFIIINELAAILGDLRLLNVQEVLMKINSIDEVNILKMATKAYNEIDGLGASRIACRLAEEIKLE